MLHIYTDRSQKRHVFCLLKLTISKRLDQLREKGKGHELISRLAKDAQTWSGLRKMLKEQMRTAQGFAEKYSVEGLAIVENYIKSSKGSVEERIQSLEEGVRDMLQLVSKMK
jgi:hypothetical protein